MPALEICRICLNTNKKLYKYDRYDLKTYYEQVIGSKVSENDGLPQHFCYECSALLHKFHKFKEKCNSGQKVIKELLQKGPIKLTFIRHIRRQTKHLQSSLNLITVSHRVKTSVIKSIGKPKLNQTVPTEIYLETASISDYDDYVDADNENEKMPPLSELVVDTNIENGEKKIAINEVKIDFVEEKIDIVHGNENIDKEKIKVTKDILKIGKGSSENKKIVGNDEKVLLEDVKLPTGNEELIDQESLLVPMKNKRNTKGNQNKKNTKGSKNKKIGNYAETNRKAKKFDITSKKRAELDPKHWSKFNLSEEEAMEEFKARAQHKRFISSEYKCNDCLKGFSNADILHRHLKLRHSESVGPVECRFCHMRFKSKCQLRQHMRQHYSKFKCLRCDLVCPLETTAWYHEEYHNGVKRKCKHCNEEFKHLTTYYTHLRTHRSDHVCTQCGASFVSVAGLSIHKKIKHIDTGDTQTAQGEEEYCKRCDMKFETKKAFEEHLIHSAMHVDGVEDPEVPAPLDRNSRKRDSQKKPRRIPTDCRICGKHFSTQAACRKHHLAEHPQTSFIAPNERQICEICGISLLPSCVPNHMNTHTREKLYSCSTCGRQFNSKGGMTKHQLTHTSEKPVACTLCDKRFKQSSSMKLHYRTFHLKEPYPKRIRKKKSEEVIKLKEESEEYIPQKKRRKTTYPRLR